MFHVQESAPVPQFPEIHAADRAAMT